MSRIEAASRLGRTCALPATSRGKEGPSSIKGKADVRKFLFNAREKLSLAMCCSCFLSEVFWELLHFLNSFYFIYLLFYFLYNPTGTPHSLKLQHYWNLTIRFSVITRTLVGGILLLSSDAVGIFYSHS